MENIEKRIEKLEHRIETLEMNKNNIWHILERHTQTLSNIAKNETMIVKTLQKLSGMPIKEKT